MTDVPKSHPRYLSLRTRDRIVSGVENGVTSIHGLIAHGRGEAFDYLIGETSHAFALDALNAAAALLLCARHPVVSVNGNSAALVGAEMVALGEALGSPLEVNIFHASKAREVAIRSHLEAYGARQILMPSGDTELEFIDSNRRFVNPEGIYRADVIFVPLEDGDRCHALVKMGKAVVTVDLNPMSRTSRTSTVSIVDNVIRAMPVLLERVETLRASPRAALENLISGYNNQHTLQMAERAIRSA